MREDHNKLFLFQICQIGKCHRALHSTTLLGLFQLGDGDLGGVFQGLQPVSSQEDVGLAQLDRDRDEWHLRQD